MVYELPIKTLSTSVEQYEKLAASSFRFAKYEIFAKYYKTCLLARKYDMDKNNTFIDAAEQLYGTALEKDLSLDEISSRIDKAISQLEEAIFHKG